MTLSVNTNSAALIALQNLNTTEGSLTQTQSEISTGLKVGSAKDNAAVWAIAQGQRADINALDSVTQSLNRATSIADVASTAGQSVSDLLTQVKAKIVAAEDPSLNTSSRTALNNDFQSLLRQITGVVNNASFDGANILNKSLTNNIQFLSNASGSSTITLGVQDLTLGGANITLTAGATLGATATSAAALLTLVNASLNNVDSALGQLGSQQNAISSQITFVSKLQDTLTTGVGNLVDANLAAESAKLQALQVQQQLGAQSLSIANQAPQVILSLFK